jgi:hypothetical protein
MDVTSARKLIPCANVGRDANALEMSLIPQFLPLPLPRPIYLTYVRQHSLDDNARVLLFLFRRASRSAFPSFPSFPSFPGLSGFTALSAVTSNDVNKVMRHETVARFRRFSEFEAGPELNGVKSRARREFAFSINCGTQGGRRANRSAL